MARVKQKSKVPRSIANANMLSNVLKKDNFPSLIFAADLIPDRWKVEKDVPLSKGININKLKPQPFLYGASIDEMRKHATKFKGNLGFADGKRMLAEQDKIPVEFRDFYIPLPGTIMRNLFAISLYLPYLVFYQEGWCLKFIWLGHVGYKWQSRARLASSYTESRKSRNNSKRKVSKSRQQTLTVNEALISRCDIGSFSGSGITDVPDEPAVDPAWGMLFFDM